MWGRAAARGSPRRQRPPRCRDAATPARLGAARRRPSFFPLLASISFFFSSASQASTAEVERALRKGEAWLEEHLHPDPYLVPYQHGANVWERNPPFPEGIKLQMDFGREGYH